VPTPTISLPDLHQPPLNADVDHIWSLIQSDLAAAVDEPTFRIWLAPLRPAGLTDTTLHLTAPPQTCGWVRDRFGRLLQTAAAATLGPHITVELASFTRTGAVAASQASAPAAPARQPATDADLLSNPKLSFEQFVIGDCNRLAHAAALAVAEMPSQAYNPLFLCGPPGVGKTHLLRAIGALLLSHDPTLIVRAITGEQFTTDFLTALSSRHTDEFKARFRRVDVLLIDDVQFLERKTRTEEEFFHTFNALHDVGSQIVLTSDRPPRSLEDLEDRLRERFACGLVADIQPPDRATRLAILRKRVAQDGIILADPGVLHVLADRVTINVRSLEGALIRVVAFGSLTNRPLTPELATEVLDGLYPVARTEPPRRSVTEIQRAACQHFGITDEELLSSARSTRVAWPRQLAMYLSRELTQESLPAIGRQFGGRDHTTVLHAWRRTAARLDSDSPTQSAIASLRDLLQ
jgi:chromosomal replication initiator protein